MLLTESKDGEAELKVSLDQGSHHWLPRETLSIVSIIRPYEATTCIIANNSNDVYLFTHGI